MVTEVGTTSELIPVSDDEEDVENGNATNESQDSAAKEEEVVDDESEELDENLIAKEINDYIKKNNVNWAEIETLEEMWAVCDAISAAHSGLPDSLLKEAFAIVLQHHFRAFPAGWTRQHLDSLTKTWKKELQNEKPTPRPTKFVAASAEYSPPVVKKRKSSAKRKKALKGLMGIGEILQQAQMKFATEEGELDVEEDDNGVFSIAGQELSFETWGAINRVKDADVVRANIDIPQQPKRVRPNKVASSQKEPANTQGSIGVSASSDVEKTIEKPAKKKLPKEKDEGEISESDDDQSDATSSSGSDESDSHVLSRQKRAKRRETERRKGPKSLANMSSMFQKFYQHRFKIAESLTLQQKATFLDLIKKNDGGINESRQQQMNQFMMNFMNSSFGSSSK